MAKEKRDAGTILADLLRDREILRVPEASDIAAAVVHELGGAGQMAKIIVDEYHRAKPGSIVRAKIVEFILRKLDTGKNTPPREKLSEADLRKLLGAEAEEYRELIGATAGPTVQPAARGPATASEEEGEADRHQEGQGASSEGGAEASGSAAEAGETGTGS